MPLETLNVRGTKVEDLSPLEGLPLKSIWCDYKPDRDARILRSIKTLETINDKPAAEFWKESGSTTATFKNSIGMKFVLIPRGKFIMGSTQAEIDHCLQLKGKPVVEVEWDRARFLSEGPEHEVEITKPFYLGVTEVTVGQFRRFVTESKYEVGDGKWLNPGWEQTDDHPVCEVTWNNAVAFCDWLSKKEGKTYRLPTEAEWEYSCRAGKSGTRYCLGDDDAELREYAWYQENSGGHTHPVGQLKPNAWGLYDIHGNAWEWCQDNYAAGLLQQQSQRRSQGPKEGDDRVARGGSFGHQPKACRAAFRLPNPHRIRYPGLSFRVASTHEPPGGVSVPPDKKTLAPPAFTNSLGMEFVLVPKGKSWLGGGGGQAGRQGGQDPARLLPGQVRSYPGRMAEGHGTQSEHVSTRQVRQGP